MSVAAGSPYRQSFLLDRARAVDIWNLVGYFYTLQRLSEKWSCPWTMAFSHVASRYPVVQAIGRDEMEDEIQILIDYEQKLSLLHRAVRNWNQLRDAIVLIQLRMRQFLAAKPNAKSIAEQTALKRVLPLLIQEEPSRELGEAVFTSLLQQFLDDLTIGCHADNLIGLRGACIGGCQGKMYMWKYEERMALWLEGPPKAVVDARAAARSNPNDAALAAKAFAIEKEHWTTYKIVCTGCYRRRFPRSYGLRFQEVDDYTRWNDM